MRHAGPLQSLGLCSEAGKNLTLWHWTSEGICQLCTWEKVPQQTVGEGTTELANDCNVGEGTTAIDERSAWEKVPRSRHPKTIAVFTGKGWFQKIATWEKVPQQSMGALCGRRYHAVAI